MPNGGRKALLTQASPKRWAISRPAGMSPSPSRISTSPRSRFNKLLKEALAENPGQTAPGRSPGKSRPSLKKWRHLRKRYKNLAKAKEALNKKLAEVSKALEDYQQEFSPAQIEQAREALSRGETREAAGLFQQAFQKRGRRRRPKPPLTWAAWPKPGSTTPRPGATMRRRPGCSRTTRHI